MWPRSPNGMVSTSRTAVPPWSGAGVKCTVQCVRSQGGAVVS
ncbi:hypothetical protein V1634_32115 [Plantactinospora veratri]|uniref:Uncharacterized protein n=1 Tax=Plantactinospora veratri TaxID=1436122 RepID=A0ABU7SK21_9ACTN